MSNFQNPFALSADEYKRDINILNHYAEDVALFLSISTSTPLEECKKYVLSNLSKTGKYPFKDAKIKYLERQENGDRVEKEGGLWEYVNSSINKNQLIAPTLTTYIPEAEKPSLLSQYIEGNIKARAKAKKEEFAAKANNDKFLEAIKKTEQTNRKLSNNAISGAHVSPSTPLYNKTAHSTLTSNCRCTSGYGNANNEKFLSGNRHYYNHHIVINNIISIVRNTDYNKLEKLIKSRNIHYPTIEETIECVRYSSNLYWFEKHYFKKIEDLINNLTPIQRAAFLYTGDMYHLKKYNNDLVFNFIHKLANKNIGECANAIDIIKSAPEDHLNLAHQICKKETAGIGKDHSKITNKNDLDTLALTCLNIANVLTEYSDLIDTLWVTKNIPSSVGYFPESIRRVAITSDTDSTIFTVQDWVNWKLGKICFTEEATSVSAVMIFLASSTITHVLAIMSANFGISKEKLFRVAMKNEFKFEVFVPTQLGKHYYANISCQEGNVFNELEMEVKGVHLKSSNAPKQINILANKMMEDIMNDVMISGEISAIKYLKQVADIERSIVKSIHAGEHTYFRASSIKNAASYTKEEELSPYAKHTFWNEVFGPKYGMMAEPPYGTVKVSVDTDTTAKFKQWVDKIEDKDFSTRLTNWMSKTEKNLISTFYIPTQCLNSAGMPVELLSVIDYRRIIRDCCNVFYILLETLGIYINGTKVTRIVSDDF